MHDENPGIVFPDRGWVELDLIPEVSTVKSARRAVAAAHPPASAEVRAKRAVSPRAKWAADHPNQSVAVNGFADPEGSKQANIDISRTRAQLVVDQLVKDGVSQQRIRLGAKGPTDFTLSSQESRRVEIAIGS